ncbi:hypothetical protein ZWY2020_038317 [Hordeum vulgare]|nr:hypothetical protein ZWY2020_038317 [Hordeum vulgare]
MSYDTNHVLALRDPGLPTPVYVRMDSSEVFYTYPTLVKSRSRALMKSDEILSNIERITHEHLFWPDGTRKVCTRAQVAKREHDNVRRLVEALLDKHNDTEVRSLLAFTLFGKWYYHLNITVKTKGVADDAGSTSLFFVEVARDRNDIRGYYINTFFRFNTDSQDLRIGCQPNGPIAPVRLDDRDEEERDEANTSDNDDRELSDVDEQLMKDVADDVDDAHDEELVHVYDKENPVIRAGKLWPNMDEACSLDLVSSVKIRRLEMMRCMDLAYAPLTSSIGPNQTDAQPTTQCRLLGMEAACYQPNMPFMN